MIAKGLTKLLNIKAMDIDTILRNTLFHIKNTGIYFTINIDKPYITDKGIKAYFINDSHTTYEFRHNLIKAVKGQNKALESFTIIYKE